MGSYAYHYTFVDANITLIRSPDDAKIKRKMLFAASKEALRRSLVGIAIEIQGTDLSEVAHETGTSDSRLLIIYDRHPCSTREGFQRVLAHLSATRRFLLHSISLNHLTNYMIPNGGQ